MVKRCAVAMLCMVVPLAQGAVRRELAAACDDAAFIECMKSKGQTNIQNGVPFPELVENDYDGNCVKFQEYWNAQYECLDVEGNCFYDPTLKQNFTDPNCDDINAYYTTLTFVDAIKDTCEITCKPLDLVLILGVAGGTLVGLAVMAVCVIKSRGRNTKEEDDEWIAQERAKMGLSPSNSQY